MTIAHAPAHGIRIEPHIIANQYPSSLSSSIWGLISFVTVGFIVVNCGNTENTSPEKQIAKTVNTVLRSSLRDHTATVRIFSHQFATFHLFDMLRFSRVKQVKRGI